MLDNETDSINRVRNNNNSASFVYKWLEEESFCDIHQTMNPDKTKSLGSDINQN